MESYAIANSNVERTVQKRVSSLKVTDRDLEILRFVLEMKFATVMDIKKKFFKYAKDRSESSSLWPTYERIQKLIENDLLIAESGVFKEKLLLIGEKGYYYLLNSYPCEKFCRPVHKIDIRTFNHDRLATSLRVELEINRSVTGWLSERAMSENFKYREILSREFRPDAIYINHAGERVAFELEISLKSNHRYDEKIHKFLEIMRSEKSLRLFDRVHYVCTNKFVAEKLEEKTQLFKNLFKIEMETDIRDEVTP